MSLFPAILIGIALSMRRELRSWGIPYLAWLAGAGGICGAFSSRYASNWYYMLPFVPPLLFFGALSLGALFAVVALETRERAHVAVALAAGLHWQ